MEVQLRDGFILLRRYRILSEWNPVAAREDCESPTGNDGLPYAPGGACSDCSVTRAELRAVFSKRIVYPLEDRNS